MGLIEVIPPGFGTNVVEGAVVVEIEVMSELAGACRHLRLMDTNFLQVAAARDSDGCVSVGVV
jgi:hypothetical protein